MRNNRIFKSTAALGLLLLAGRMYAQAAADHDQHVADVCAKATSVSLPEVASLAKPERDKLETCDPAGLYYAGTVTGLYSADNTTGPDHAAALKCALSRFAKPATEDDDEEHALTVGTLAMIYANGDGVPRSKEIAIAIVCRGFDDPSSMPGAVHMIQNIEAASKEKPYDFCATDGGDFWKIVSMECDALEAAG